MKPRLTTPQRRKLAQKFAEGFSVTELAREFGVDRHTVTRQLDRAGIVAPSVNSLTPAELASLRAVLASVSRSSCPKCGAELLRPRVVVAGECRSCGTAWTCSRQSATARR